MSHSDDATPGHAPTARGYVMGYLAALVLTLIPFGAVYYDLMSQGAILLVIAITAVLQLGVHLRFFLHLDMSQEQRWNTISVLFSVFTMFIMVGGTLWLFYSLYARHMMIGY
ncbi:cytochrome o ubiquinol oxidase subunit IV [Salinisphaera sp.]|uniref:cytochrome o ubiquinol oxidase subunit IV n=1 Tax=Salinisphaera sp. TaxID=1914330 RepID=UPI000C6B883A|nr:cytochrome o ubiquinol oxidase subunit IV [Salinisphaera sp.]MAS11302.1 cytochrome o ubiquinol oxidase subunit IV [Salinisphaera sp.]|tara:strand:- start:14 stop:349 length:336 start_codon:yes stop_codon:yes gene_type:complete